MGFTLPSAPMSFLPRRGLRALQLDRPQNASMPCLALAVGWIGYQPSLPNNAGQSHVIHGQRPLYDTRM